MVPLLRTNAEAEEAVLISARRFIGHQNSKIKIENAVVSNYDGFSLNANGGTIIELDEEINMTEYQPPTQYTL